MHRTVIKRKNRILSHIKDVRSLSPTERSNESMCGCYILAFGAIEFMIETLIRGWIRSNTRKHKHPYKGKSDVDNVIKVLEDLAETNIKGNHAIKYSKICELVEKLAGSAKKDIFKNKIDSAGGATTLVAAIDRIELTRHQVAHGNLWPNEISPNLDELENDFLYIYGSLISALNETLPRY